MSSHGRIVILHRNGKDGPTYCLRQRICTIGRSRSCNIRMNIDQVADQHAWITIDSKDQVWIANATEGQELRVNSKILPAGSRPMQLFHSSIIYIEGRAFRFEEETMIQEKPSDKESPENMVVEESPVKEKHPPPPESSSPKQQENQSSSAANNTALSSLSTTPLASSTTLIKEPTPRVGVKRSLAQSFDEVEHSPAKRQRLEAPATISRSVEIPVKKSCLSPAKHTRSEPKQKTLHQVRFMLPSKLVVKPHASSEIESPAKKQSISSSSSDASLQSKDISSSESDRAPRPATKKAIAPKPKKSKYKSRYVESKGKRSKPPQNKSDGKSKKRQSLISVILQSSESESEESSCSESVEDCRKNSHNNGDKASKDQSVHDNSDEESVSDSDVRNQKSRSQPPSKHPSSASKVIPKAIHKDGESDEEYSGSDRSGSCSDSESRSDKGDGDANDASDASDASDDGESNHSDSGDSDSDSESESTVNDKPKDWSDNSNEATKAAPNKRSTSSDLSNQSVKGSASTAKDVSSDSSATSYRKTSSDILREEEEAEQKLAQQQNPTANVVDNKDKKDDTVSPPSSQTVIDQPSLEERIDRIAAETSPGAVSCLDDLKAALVVVFRRLGCDRAYLIKEIVEHTLPLLPKSFTSTDANWEIKLTDSLLVITDVIPRSNALYYRLKAEFFPKISLEQKLQVEHCESYESPSSDSQSKHVPYPSPSVNIRNSEEILIHGSYEEIFVRLQKKKSLLADITKRKMEPESIKALKRAHGLADKRNRLLCGGLADDEVRLVLSALAELFPKVAFEFVLSSLFTTAVAIILLSRRPGTHHDDILARIGTRCVEVQARVTGTEDGYVLTPVDVPLVSTRLH